ncbi:hypothetical protein EXIGLDRAFT_700142 [Exidia glandulosa HHB12029]|uniref:Uncharacterized protein n=1 Tax=Exidia glandulosa HHB12029 TaxID=1314781 RepID=A0A165DKF6_EXIGL|nr:hypothetical protein EXIGLDRAFT_700142 [Exidia glandulosa HHB12029]
MSNFLSGTVTPHLTFEESFERSTPYVPFTSIRIADSLTRSRTYELPVLHHPQPSYVCKYQHCMKDTRFKTSIEKAFHDQNVLGIHCVVCHKYYLRKLVLELRAHYIKHHPEYVQNYLEQERRMKDAYAKAQADQEAQQAQAQAQAQCQYQGQQQDQGYLQYSTYSRYLAQSQGQQQCSRRRRC